MTARSRGAADSAPERADDGVETVDLAGDKQLAYTQYGRSDGVPVVFLHGTPGSRRLGALLDAPAMDAGVRVLAPDRPGYGRSSPWPDRSAADDGRIVEAVLDDAGVETAGLVAFSGGALPAFATAATRPERVERVDVVSGATPPSVSVHTPAAQRFLAGLATRTPFVLRGLLRGQAWLAGRLDPSFVVAQYTTGDADTVADEVAAVVRDDFVEAFARSRRGAATEFGRIADEWRVDLAAIQPAVHLWHGTDDTNVPIGDARRLDARLPDAHLHVLEGADHLRALVQCAPDLLAERR
jgi:pimeloyl-ACP methyl ester carboxylesterase